MLVALASATVFVSRCTAHRVRAGADAHAARSDFSAHLQAVADGNYRAEIPAFRVREINGLSESMRRMAASVLERETRLVSNEARISSILECSGDAICDLQGRLSYVNQQATRLLGYRRDQLLAMRTMPDHSADPPRPQAPHAWSLHGTSATGRQNIAAGLAIGHGHMIERECQFVLKKNASFCDCA